ncbi:6-bladed beta-propeller [Gracilimonas tropica]|uniref:6-bladed beta-propeller n=1 Tax=Gracilimonas tropica TaxID=454600 RepID=UPI000371513F|nr:6-bladed beta-propeller [Gracilimonas tropica]
MKIFLSALTLVLVGCSVQDQNRSVQEFKDLNNVTVYSKKTSEDTLFLKPNGKFGDTEQLFFSSMGEFAVDDSGRVYIADAGWGSRSLHVYNPDGSYLKKIAGEGKGPAEFLSLSNLQVHAGQLLFYDSQLQRIMLYSTATLKQEKTVLTDSQKWKDILELSDKRPHEFYLSSPNEIIAAFQESPQINNSGRRMKKYYRLNSELEIVSDQLAELKAKKFVHSNSEDKVGNMQVRFMKYFPFFERHFFVPSKEDHFYIVDSRDFLVKKLDYDGDYLSAFFYPYELQEVRRKDALHSANEMVENIAQNVDLPEKWPAINSILLDDENRFWISTFTGDNEFFKWWVLEESGELIATFRWPGDKYSDPASLENHVVVKGGYFYQREKNEDTGQWNIVRYSIEFTAR